MTFSTTGALAGEPLPYSMSQSLTIDMTGQTFVTATFNINTGWSFGGSAWGKTVPAGADLMAVLVEEAPMTEDA